MRTSTGSDGVILGVSCDYHDAAAAVLVDGAIVAAAEEERFTRTKHDPALPVHAIAWCLEQAGIEPDGLGAVAFHDKPFATYERILATHAVVGPRGFPNLSRAIARWSTSKLWIGFRLERALQKLGYVAPRPTFAGHHQSHAASAFYPSPFERAAILTFDGVGEWSTSSIARGDGNRIDMLVDTRFPHSLGLFYSAMAAFCGFAVNDGEYKLMGLAPYGTPRYADALRREVIDIADDGSIRLDQRWFDYRAGSKMTTHRIGEILGGPGRTLGDDPGQREADIARSVQVVIEDAVLAMALHAKELTGADQACLAGGVALNCVANARLLDEGVFEDIWVQPAAGDSGGAVGAALWTRHQFQDHPRTVGVPDGMSGAFLGPAFSNQEVSSWLTSNQVGHVEHDDHDALCRAIAAELAAGKVVGWFQDAMEFGPRALGHRSILADPRDASMVARINGAVKGREGFRPFAPAVLADEAGRWFDLDRDLAYMTVTAAVRSHQPADADPGSSSFAERLGGVRSAIPAVTHVDGSARVQTVDADRNPRFHRLLQEFGDLTGCPVLVNTSFNRAGEPIVRTPADALRCFGQTDIDLLVMERCVVDRSAAGLGAP